MTCENNACSPSGMSAQLFDFPSAATENCNNLPALTARVVGRAEVIDVLAQEVRKSPLVSIVGAGGIGKTTVAVAVAERAIGAFPDGVWLVDFAPLRDPSLVPHAIASAMGLAVHSGNALAALCRFLRERRMLLVLDNCEHMALAIVACLAQILREAPSVHVLTTSRAALRIEGEQVHRLSGLSSPLKSIGLTARNALAYPAIELFVDRATDRLETFKLSDDDAPTVADICTSLDGIALAIELAAMRVDVFGVKGLKKQLDGRFRLLSGRRAGLERHRTLAATLDWSYSLLPEKEADMLRTLSVFRGAFRLAGASAVVNVVPDVAADFLAEIASKSLLSVEVDAVDRTYRLMETTRAYCLEKLAATGEDQCVHRRHAQFVCDVLERAAGEWEEQLSRDWGATYGFYLDDLRAALAWASSDPAHRSLQIRLTAAATLLWNHFSLTDESRIHLTRVTAGLGEAGSEGTASEMHLKFALAGAILYTRGVTPEARLALSRAIEISERLGDIDFRLRCLRLIATFQLFSGEHDKGIRTLETFLGVAAVEEPSALAEGETHLGCAEYFVGRLHSARRRIERLHPQVSQDFNDARFARFQYSNSVSVLIVQCHVEWLTGLPDAAVRTAKQVVEYARQASHELSMCIALAWVSILYFWAGREEDCNDHVALLDELVERHGIVTWRPVVTFCRGALAANQQPPRSSDGIDQLRHAVTEFRAIGHMARLPYYIGILAEALGRHSRFEEAEAAIREALQLAKIQNDRWCPPELLRIQASIALAQEQQAKGEELLHLSIAAAREIGALPWQLRASNDLARLWQSQSRAGEAKAMLRAVYDDFCEGFETRDLLVAARLLAARE